MWQVNETDGELELTHYIDEESCEDESTAYLIPTIMFGKYGDTVRVSDDAIERAGINVRTSQAIAKMRVRKD